MRGAKNCSVSSALQLQFNDTVAAESKQHSTPFIQEDGVVRYVSDFLTRAASDQLLAQSLAEISWTQDHIKLFGRLVAVPRLSAWFSSINATYKYSGLVHQPQKLPDFVEALLREVVSRTEIEFNSILMNLYQDGNHSMGWHADDEPELGPEVTIASLSVGAAREIRFRHRHKIGLKVLLPVAHGSILMMYPPLQKYWLHELPKRKSITTPRVNFSFRVVHRA